jgi:hypothetical protein
MPPWKLVTAVIPPLAGGPTGASGAPLTRLKIVRPAPGDNARTQPYKLYVNDVEAGVLETPLRDQAPRMTLGIFVRAMKNTPVEFAVDNVKVYERKESDR